jgi:hypothetical protein
MLIDKRIQKIKEDLEVKALMIDEFSKTLNNLDWNDKLI